MLLGAIAIVFYALQEKRNAALQKVQEDALWATYQLASEATKLNTALLQASVDPTSTDVDDLILRYDILYSRFGLLQQGYFSRSFADTVLPITVGEAKNQFLDLEQDFIELAEQRDIRSLNMERVTGVLSLVRADSEKMLIEANAARSSAAVRTREEEAVLYNFLGIGVVMFALTLGGLIALLGAQLRQLRRTGQALEKASEETKRAAQELGLARSRLAQIIASSPAVTYAARIPDYAPTYISPNVEQILGYTPLEVTRNPNWWFEALHPEDKDRIIGISAEWVKAGALNVLEQNYRIRRSDGIYIWVNDRLNVVRDADGAMTEIVGSHLDVTEAHKLELERAEVQYDLEIALVEARSADRAKSDFIAVMSHEIRTPLNGVLGIMELMESTRLDRRQHHMLAEARVAGEALLTLLSNVLDFSKFEVERLELKDVLFSPRMLVQQVLTILRQQSIHSGVSMTSHVDTDVPLWANGDPDRLQQILLNLVGNAIKFAENGSVFIHVTVAVDEAGNKRLCCEVVDDGIGVPEHMHIRVFQPFITLDPTSSRRFGGTGLGLAISQKIVAAMGGEIGVRSVSGLGSTFWFTVPLRAAVAPAIVCNPVSVAPDQSRRTLHILLAEDNPTNQLVARGMLEGAGHVVEVVSSGADAVAAVRRKDYDCVLMDIAMPGMDGKEATRMIRAISEKAKQMPIIAMTAYVAAQDRQGIMEAGLDGFVGKPIRGVELLDEIARAIQVKGEPKEFFGGSVASPIDGIILGNLIRLMGVEQARRIVEDWATDCERAVGTMVAADENKASGLSKIEREAHRLASSALQIGASLIGDEAGTIEEACRSGDAARARRHVCYLVREEPRIRQLLAHFMKSAAA